MGFNPYSSGGTAELGRDQRDGRGQSLRRKPTASQATFTYGWLTMGRELCPPAMVSCSEGGVGGQNGQGFGGEVMVFT